MHIIPIPNVNILIFDSLHNKKKTFFFNFNIFSKTFIFLKKRVKKCPTKLWWPPLCDKHYYYYYFCYNIKYNLRTFKYVNKLL